jgi:hypothetical protein
MSRKALLFVAIPLVLSCVCVAVFGALAVRASNEDKAKNSTATARAGQFIDPLKALCAGQSSGVSGAGTFTQGAGVHPMIAFRTTNATNYFQDMNVGTGDWRAANLDNAQLVLCTEESRATIETCPYKSESTGTTSYIDRSQQQVKLRLIAAKSGQVVGTQTLKGAEPRQCNDKETFASGVNRFTISGESVTPAAIQTWLKPYVAP